MNSSTFCSLFLGLILISQSPLPANARGLKGKLVNELCNDNYIHNKIGCHNILGSNPEAMKAKNNYQLIKAVLTIAINKSVEAQNILKGLAASAKSPALTKCANSDYDDVVSSFKSYLACLPKIGSSNYDDDMKTYGLGINYTIATSYDPITECFSGIEAEHIVNTQVTDLNNEIILYMDMAYVATDNIVYKAL